MKLIKQKRKAKLKQIKNKKIMNQILELKKKHLVLMINIKIYYRLIKYNSKINKEFLQMLNKC